MLSVRVFFNQDEARWVYGESVLDRVRKFKRRFGAKAIVILLATGERWEFQ